MLKKSFFTLSLFLLFIFSSCSNIFSGSESYGSSIDFALGDRAARNVVETVSANEVVNDDSQLKVVCELLRGDVAISTDTKTVLLKELKNTVFNLKNILYGNNYFISLKIYFNDILIYKALSESIELNDSNEHADINLPLQVNKSKISYELNQGEFVPGTVKPLDYFINSDVILPEPERPLFNFGGWFLNSDFTGERITKLGKNKFIGDVTLYALWTGKDQISPVVITPSDTTKVDFSDKITLSCPTSGASIYYTTDGSEPDKTSHLYNDTSKITVDDNLITGGDTFIIKAIALKDKMADSKVSERSYSMNRYSVTFNENNHGTAPVQAKGLKKGDTVTEPEKLSDIGYIFGDWYKEPSCKNKWDFSTDKISESITLYAKWTPITYKVIFHKNDGTPEATEEKAEQILTYDKPASLTATTFTKTNFGFAGWATTADGTKAYDNKADVVNLSSTANGEYHLYAVWVENKYTVVFNSNYAKTGVDEAAPVNQEFVYSTPNKLTANTFAKTGYTFKEWNTSADGSGTAYADGASVSELTSSGNFKLYAQWTPVTYKVVFHKNDGTPADTEEKAEQTFTYDQSNSLTINTFTRIDFVFNGWATAAGGAKAYDDNATVLNLGSTADGVVHLYARWCETIAPGEVTNLATMAKDKSTVTLSWTNPTDADFDKVVITYGSNGKTEVLKSASPNNSVEITGLTAGSKVSFTVKAVDNAEIPNESSGVSVLGFPNDDYSLHLHTEPTISVLPGGGATAIVGDWPQTVKDYDVRIIESNTKTIAGMTCYLGNDNNYYVKVTAMVYGNVAELSRGRVFNGDTHYVKIEPISWTKHGDFYYSDYTLVGHAHNGADEYLSNTFIKAFGTGTSISPSLPDSKQVTSEYGGFRPGDTPDPLRRCTTTDYGVLTGGYKQEGGGASWWWLKEADGRWVSEDAKVITDPLQPLGNTSGTVRVVISL